MYKKIVQVLKFVKELVSTTTTNCNHKSMPEILQAVNGLSEEKRACSCMLFVSL